jgi:hypothetical protein
LYNISLSINDFLRFAGNKTCIRDVAAKFSIGESTFHRQCARVMDYLNDIAPTIIKFPDSKEKKAAIAQQFEQVYIYILCLNW